MLKVFKYDYILQNIKSSICMYEINNWVMGKSKIV